MIRDFIAIDFETANLQPSSVCSIGVVMVRNGQIVDSFYSLIQPKPNYYNYWCQRVHGLSQCDTDDAPVFSKVWQQLEEKIADVFFSDQQSIDDLRYQIASIPFVAHNAHFDEGCLKAVFKVYQMDYPDYHFYDTLAAARRQFGHSLPNHQLRHDQIIFALPLFVECVPSIMLEFLETLPTERQQPAQMSFILHGGFDEGHQLRLCERFLQSLPAQLGCIYGGCLVQGGSFLIRMRDDEKMKKAMTKNQLLLIIGYKESKYSWIFRIFAH